VKSAITDLAGRAESLCLGCAEVSEFNQRGRADEVTAHLVARKGGKVDRSTGMILNPRAAAAQ
jgi:hypothetical protein